MTTQDYIEILEAELHIGGVTIQVDRPTILTALNESAQNLYPVMLLADGDYWTKSHVYGSSTDWAFVDFANYFRLRSIDATGALARPASFEEWQTIQNNGAEQGTAASPIYRIDPTGIHFSSAVAGTMYAYVSFGQIYNQNHDTDHPLGLNTDLTDPVTGIIPWAFEEVFVLEALRILAMRQANRPDIEESEVAKLFKIVSEAKNMLDIAKQPIPVFRETRETPKFPK